MVHPGRCLGRCREPRKRLVDRGQRIAVPKPSVRKAVRRGHLHRAHSWAARTTTVPDPVARGAGRATGSRRIVSGCCRDLRDHRPSLPTVVLTDRMAVSLPRGGTGRVIRKFFTTHRRVPFPGGLEAPRRAPLFVAGCLPPLVGVTPRKPPNDRHRVRLRTTNDEDRYIAYPQAVDVLVALESLRRSPLPSASRSSVV